MRLVQRGGGGEDDGRSGVEELGAVMFADAEDVEADLVGERDLVEQMLHALLGVRVGPVRGRDGCCKAVDADLQLCDSLFSQVTVGRLCLWMLRCCNSFRFELSHASAASSSHEKDHAP